MDAMEAAVEESSAKIMDVLDKRRAVFQSKSQHRLYFAEKSTDDSAAAVVGSARTVRYLIAWFEVITRFNIIMAPPRKRQLGCRLEWIGTVFLATRLVTTQLQKRIRAVAELKLLLAGRLPRSGVRQ